MNPTDLKYKIIDECKCGFEELFNLIGLIDYDDPKEIDRFSEKLVGLHKSGFLICKYDSNVRQTISEKQIKDHLQLRIENGEEIESYPKNGKEFSFFATDIAIDQLLEKDRPITK